MKIINLNFVLVLSLLIIGCSASLTDLNTDVQSSLKINEQLKQNVTALDEKFWGADKNTILAALGKPRRKSLEPYPYKLNPFCQGNNCEKGFSDEIWFYAFKKKFSTGWEVYSVYVYFKNDKVVRVR